MALKKRMLCLLCAVALVLGLLPVSAWAENESVSQDASTRSNEKTSLLKEDEGDEVSQEDVSGSISNDKDEIEEGVTSGEDAALVDEVSKAEVGNDPDSNNINTELGKIELVLQNNTITLSSFKCPLDVCSEFHMKDAGLTEDKELIHWSVNMPFEKISSAGYNFFVLVNGQECEFNGTLSQWNDHGTLGIYAPTLSTPGTYQATIALAKSERTDEGLKMVGEPIAQQPLTIVVKEIPFKTTITPIDGIVLVPNPEKDRFQMVESFFEIDNITRCLLNIHNEVFNSFVSSDPSVIKIEGTGRWVESIYAQKPGTTTLTYTVNGISYKNTVTVKDWNDLDYSRLKFTQKTMELKPGSFVWNDDVFLNYIDKNGSKDVVGSFYIDSSDDSVLNYPFPDDEPLTGDGGGIRLTACKPGTAKLNLYFYNEKTGQSVLTDTMFVTVKDTQSFISSATKDSLYSGDILSSTPEIDQLVKEKGLSLKTSLLHTDALNYDQLDGISEVMIPNEDIAVLLEISLIQKDGTIFNEYDMFDWDGTFTVRVKIEGELARLNPDSLRVYRITDYGPQPIVSWVYDGYLYISSDHFSPYAVIGSPAQINEPEKEPNGSGDKSLNGDNIILTKTKKDDSSVSTDKSVLAKTSDEFGSVIPLVFGAAFILCVVLFLSARMSRRILK